MVHNHSSHRRGGECAVAHAYSKRVSVCVCMQNCPQMALQCYRKALETDPQCVCALYQSILVYRKLANTQAEIQALRLLHSVSNTSAHSREGRECVFGDKLYILLEMFSVFVTDWKAPCRWAKCLFGTPMCVHVSVGWCSETWNPSCPAGFDVALCHRALSSWHSFPVPILTAAEPVFEQPAVSSLCPLRPSQPGPEVCATREVRRLL